MADFRSTLMAVLVLVTLLQGLAIGALVVLTEYEELRDTPAKLLGSSVAACFAAALVCYVGNSRLNKTGTTLKPVFFLFTVFTAFIDLISALGLLGKTDIANFYFENGEEYFKSSWGLGAMLWDGSVHFILQIIIACGYIAGFDPKFVTLFWCGSIMNSLPVLLMGAASGEFSDKIHPAISLNAPYLVIPLFIALAECRTKAEPKQVNSRLLEFLIALGSVAVLVFHTVRAMVVLDSQSYISTTYAIFEPELMSGFAKSQAMQNFFVFGYWHLLTCYESMYRAIYGISSGIFGGKEAYYAAFVGGAVAQGQFCHFISLSLKWENFSVTQRDPTVEAVLGNAIFLQVVLFQTLLWCNGDPLVPTKRQKTD